MSSKLSSPSLWPWSPSIQGEQGTLDGFHLESTSPRSHLFPYFPYLSSKVGQVSGWETILCVTWLWVSPVSEPQFLVYPWGGGGWVSKNHCDLSMCLFICVPFIPHCEPQPQGEASVVSAQVCEKCAYYK